MYTKEKGEKKKIIHFRYRTTVLIKKKKERDDAIKGEKKESFARFNESFD